jgi:predicted ATPase
VFAAIVHQLRRERQATLEKADQAIELSTEHGLALLSWATLMQGWARVPAHGGEGEEVIEPMRESLAASRAGGSEMLNPYFLALLAEALGNLGRYGEALAALTEAQDTEERYHEAELHRLGGELLLKQTIHEDTVQPDPSAAAKAESWFRQAIATAHQRQAKSLELRATTSLYRLYAKQGKKAEGRRMLREIYGSFTEGFDSADLMEAATLLDEWQSAT